MRDLPRVQHAFDGALHDVLTLLHTASGKPETGGNVVHNTVFTMSELDKENITIKNTILIGLMNLYYYIIYSGKDMQMD